MGWCGFKISGHTGTDFKHRKAFHEKMKPLVQNNKYTRANDPTYSFQKLQKDRAQKKQKESMYFIMLFLLALVLYLIFWFYG